MTAIVRGPHSWFMPKTFRASDQKARAGARLRAARLALGLTQAVIARACGISPQSWSGWERGDDMPDPAVIARAFPAFGITPDWVFLGLLHSTPSALAAELRARAPDLLFGADGATPAENQDTA